MDGSRDNGQNALFMPLTGQENTSRLEQKFEHYFDSEEEDSETCIPPTLGKISQWKVETPKQWLNSQTHRGKTALVTGGKEKLRSPRGKKRSEASVKFSPKDKQKSSATCNSPKASSSRQETCKEQSSISGPVKSFTRAGEIHKWLEDGTELEVVGSRASTGKVVKNKSLTDRDGVGTTKPQLSDETDQSPVIKDGDESFMAGFSPEDTERPKFTAAPVGAKVALLLSSEDSELQIEVPATINQYLRDYQREGIRFLYQHYVDETGAILGDDMGLGKTIQVIGFLAALLGKKGNHIDMLHRIPKFIRQMSDDMPDSPPRQAQKPFLIIGPSAVMYNWLDELDTWGYFSACKFHGSDKENSLKELQRGKVEIVVTTFETFRGKKNKFHGSDKENCLKELQRGKVEIVVTTFETFRDNVARLNEIEWQAVIVDEVHKIKGLRAQVTQALRIIKTHCRYGLTGTALQNNMTELWSLLDWAQPRVLGTLEQFQTEYVDVIEIGQRHDATKRELALARKQKDKFSEVRKKMLLRRTKALIADQLPTKEDLVVMCRLTDLQVSVYKAILTHPDMDLVLRAEDPCECRSGKLRASCCYKYAADGTKAWALIFSYMHLLLKAANHTALLIPDKNMKEKQAKLAHGICEVAFRDHPQFVEQARNAVFRTLSDPKYCGKMKILQGLLSVFYANHDKVLIFSYSTKLLDIIEQYVISEGHEYRRIDGKTSSRHRQDIVTQFNKDRNIFLCLISTKAGGLGLNLTGANRVVVFDPNWNPSHDLQAQDRAYRIGQTRDVKVYRFVSAGTIEENIYLRQIYKQQLGEVAIGTGNAHRYFTGIQGDKAHQGELFGVKNMFSLRTGTSCLTMDILKRSEKLERGLAGYDITRYVPLSPTAATSEVSDTEDSEGEGRSVVDPDDDDDEEDDEFLKDLFGSERDPIGLNQPTHGRESAQTSELSKVTSSNVDRDSSYDDGEFSLIPNLHHKHQSHTSNRPSPFADREVQGISEKLGASSSRTANPNDRSATSLVKSTKVSMTPADKNHFSATDITFSTTTCRTPDSFLLRQSVASSSDKPSRKRGAVSGISWLFSDSDDDGGDVDDAVDINTREVIRVKTHEAATRDVTPSHTHAASTSSSRHLVKSASGVGRRQQSSTTTSEKPQVKTGMDSKAKTTSATKPKPGNTKFPSEQSVLESAGVLHTHVNRDVVGASRAEDHMSRRALEDVFERHTNTQAPANFCDPYSQPEEEEGARKKGKKGRARSQDDHNTRKCISSGSFKILVGQTPSAIRRQQWSDLCKVRGEDQIALAERVLTSSVTERLDILREFYTHKHPQLAQAVHQLFTLSQSGNQRKKQQEQADVSVTSSPREQGSSVTTTNITHTAVKSLTSSTCDPSSARHHPWSARRKHPAASLLFDLPMLNSETQESVTAHSPDIPDVLSVDEISDFLPVPPPSARKSRIQAKVSPGKSQHVTRLRQSVKRMNADEGKNFVAGASSAATYTNICPDRPRIDPSLVDVSIGSLADNDQTTAEIYMNIDNLPQAQEDIPTLLHEMGRKVSSNEGDNRTNWQMQQKEKGKKSLATEKSEKQTARSSETPLVAKSKTVPVEPSTSTSRQQIRGSNQRKYTEILDDIFCISPPELGKEPSSPKRSKLCDEAVCATSIGRSSIVSHLEMPAPSTSHALQSKMKLPHCEDTESCVAHERFQTSKVLAAENDQSDIFDVLLSTSTLKDERVDCFSRSDRKRKRSEKRRVLFSDQTCDKTDSETRDGEGGKGDNCDDLDGLKFELGNVRPGSGSGSLFS